MAEKNPNLPVNTINVTVLNLPVKTEHLILYFKKPITWHIWDIPRM